MLAWCDVHVHCSNCKSCKKGNRLIKVYFRFVAMLLFINSNVKFEFMNQFLAFWYRLLLYFFFRNSSSMKSQTRLLRLLRSAVLGNYYTMSGHLALILYGINDLNRIIGSLNRLWYLILQQGCSSNSRH